LALRRTRRYSRGYFVRLFLQHDHLEKMFVATISHEKLLALMSKKSASWRRSRAKAARRKGRMFFLKADSTSQCIGT
jgi:hypothetical protein